jgi:two-component system nitrate/nitrite response regulator NarL
MNTGHYFLLESGAPLPARWCQAFPGATVLGVEDLARLPAQASGSAANHRVLWLSTGHANWAERLGAILASRPGEQVVVLSSQPQDSEALCAVAAGARGYAHLYAVPALLQEVALVVLHGGLWMGPGLMQRLIAGTGQALSRQAPDAGDAHAGWGSLSAREAEVAFAVSSGHSNKEVAALLGITERTVKAHLGAAFEKLGVRDRLQLVLRLSQPGAEPANAAAAAPAGQQVFTDALDARAHNKGATN